MSDYTIKCNVNTQIVIESCKSIVITYLIYLLTRMNHVIQHLYLKDVHAFILNNKTLH